MRCIILAAGKGKRLQSEEFQLPKALRLLNGKPLLSYVLESITGFIEDRDIVIVVGFMGEKIIELYKDKGRYNFVWQREQLGTGHAVMMAEDYFEENCNLILMGDMPFIKESTLREFLTFHDKNKNDLSILTVSGSEDSSFGRIVRDKSGKIEKIVEVKDASEQVKKIKELNTGVMVMNRAVLDLLDLLKTNNAQKEYYLTDLIGLSKEKGYKVDGYCSQDEMQFFGINTLNDLKIAQNYLLHKF